MFVSNQQLNIFAWDNIHKISYECFYILLEILNTYPKQAVENRPGENNVNSQFLTFPRCHEGFLSLKRDTYADLNISMENHGRRKETPPE